jgi:D-amino-acid dehydrogenase
VSTAGTYDAVVVGGGLVGAALAYELTTAGATVALVDRHDRGRATDAGAGILSPPTWPSADDDWFAFARTAGDHYRRVVPELEELGVGPCGYAPCGLLSVSIIPGDEDWFDQLRAQAMRRSPGVVEEISVDEARRRFPPIGAVRRALYSPSSARVDGRLMAAALLEGARRRGLTVLEASVTQLQGTSSVVERVRTPSEELACGAVVIAGGAWSAAFARHFDAVLPITPLKGQIVHLELPDRGDPTTGARGLGRGDPATGEWPILQPVMSYYLVPWPDGRVACGGTLEGEAGYDARPTVYGVHQLLRECLAVAPGLADAALREVRVGLRPASVDDRPVLGALPGWDNAYVATGHGAEGLLLGPYSAALVAAAMGAGRAGADLGALAPFSAARFGVGPGAEAGAR